MIIVRKYRPKILFYHLTVLNSTIQTANVNVLPIIETI